MSGRASRLLCFLAAGLISLSALAQRPPSRPSPAPSGAGSGGINAIHGDTMAPVNLNSHYAEEEGRVEFKSETVLIEVPVVVSDKSGNHVHGLSKDDFQLWENGKEQKMANFEEVNARDEKFTLHSPAPGEFTNLMVDGAQPRSLSVIALDTVNTPFLDQTYGRQQLLKYLSTHLEPNQLLAMVVISSRGLRLIHGLTGDPATLIEALKKSSGEIPAMNGIDVDTQAAAAAGQPNSFNSFDIFSADVNDQAALQDFVGRSDALIAQFEQERAIETTMRAFIGIAWSLSGVPGRKSLIWATGGFPFAMDSPSAVPGGYLSQLYERAMGALNSAQISIYPVDVRGLINSSSAADAALLAARRNMSAANSVRALNSRLWLQNSTVDTLRDFASMTGGRAFYNNNDIEAGFRRAIQDGSSFYLLSYYLDTRNNKAGWRQLKVKLRRDAHGAELRARNGFFVTNAAFNPGFSRQTDINMALTSPFESTAIPMTVRWLGTAAEGDKKKVQFKLDLPPNALTLGAQNHVDLDYVAMAFAARDGKDAGSFGKSLQGNIPEQQMATVREAGMGLRNEIALPPGSYTVRFVIRDNLSGKVGSVTAPLRVD